MPLTFTATTSPANPCSPASPTYSFTANNTQSGDFSAVGNTITVNQPNTYTATVGCAGGSSLCNQSRNIRACCYSYATFPSSLSVLNVTLFNPLNGSTINLNTQPGLSFPYVVSTTGLASLAANISTWSISSGVFALGCQGSSGYSNFILTKNGDGAYAILTWLKPISFTTNAGTFPFNTPICNPPSLSVSATAVGLVLTANVTGCTSPLYTWTTPGNILVDSTQSITATVSGNYTVRVLCTTTNQWISTTINVP